jgi:hypothetical protein
VRFDQRLTDLLPDPDRASEPEVEAPETAEHLDLGKRDVTSFASCHPLLSSAVVQRRLAEVTARGEASRRGDRYAAQAQFVRVEPSVRNEVPIPSGFRIASRGRL